MAIERTETEINQKVETEINRNRDSDLPETEIIPPEFDLIHQKATASPEICGFNWLARKKKEGSIWTTELQK